jgi:hypothetical protein
MLDYNPSQKGAANEAGEIFKTQAGARSAGDIASSAFGYRSAGNTKAFEAAGDAG